MYLKICNLFLTGLKLYTFLICRNALLSNATFAGRTVSQYRKWIASEYFAEYFPGTVSQIDCHRILPRDSVTEYSSEYFPGTVSQIDCHRILPLLMIQMKMMPILMTN